MFYVFSDNLNIQGQYAIYNAGIYLRKTRFLNVAAIWWPKVELLPIRWRRMARDFNRKSIDVTNPLNYAPNPYRLTGKYLEIPTSQFASDFHGNSNVIRVRMT